jgi:hypothetical protein
VLFHLEVGKGLPWLVLRGGLRVDHSQFRAARERAGNRLCPSVSGDALMGNGMPV